MNHYAFCCDVFVLCTHFLNHSVSSSVANGNMCLMKYLIDVLPSAARHFQFEQHRTVSKAGNLLVPFCGYRVSTSLFVEWAFHTFLHSRKNCCPFYFRSRHSIFYKTLFSLQLPSWVLFLQLCFTEEVLGFVKHSINNLIYPQKS